MKNDIIASISVFGVYHDNNKDAYDVVSDFIKAALATKKQLSFTVEVVQSLLEELYAIHIPISIIKGLLKRSIGITLSKSNNVYSIDVLPNDSITEKIEELKCSYDYVISALSLYLQENASLSVAAKYPKEELISQFASYVIDDYANDEVEKYIKAFIIHKKDDPTFRLYFNQLSAGLISYHGLQYFDNTNTLGRWPSNGRLTVFLDTEFLFGCAGYHDPYYKKVFNEFLELVKEINASNKGQELISLRFLSETMVAFNGVFNGAKQLLEKKQAPDPSKEALVKLIQESHSISDIDIHRASILSTVKQSGILYDDNDYSSFSTNPDYVIFGKEEHTRYVEDNYNGLNNEGKVDYYSRVLTIINGLRRGEIKRSFENCRYVFLTNSRIGHKLAFDQAQQKQNSVPLATDMDWITSRFWYKLNKSFSSDRLPLSLDIVARSQAALNDDVSIAIKTRFEDIKKKKLSDDVKKELYAGIRVLQREIELYDSQSLPEILEFISYDDTEAYITAQYKMKSDAAKLAESERHLLETQDELRVSRQKGYDAVKTVSSLQKELRIERHKPLIKRIKRDYFISHFSYWFVVCSVFIGLGYVLFKYINFQGIWAVLFPAIVDVLGVAAYFLPFHKRVYAKISKYAIISYVLKKNKNR
ncbi:MAG: hypothetical protein IKR30_05005 [Bacteroidales bacterium]|nr:hypothetical protein [Bacteroidales bacterium]